MNPDETLYKYLDARFSSIEGRMDRHERWHERWLEEGIIPRVERLEKWRSYLTGAWVVIVAIVSWIVKYR